MPESVKDRCTKSHEYIFLLSKQPHYYFDNEAIREKGVMTRNDSAGSRQQDTRNTHRIGGGNSGISLAKEKLAKELSEKGYSSRNKRDVWSVTTKAVKEAHFATFPEELIKPCILAGSRANGIVLDPFFGSGTTGRVATELNRKYIGIELNPEYIEISGRRTNNVQLSLFGMM
jgi:DNA modification methylase